jgi:hypothetical protein
MQPMTKKPTTMTPADALRVKEVNDIFTRLEEVMCYLSSRWADEHEYEDIADYQKRLESDLATMNVVGFTITKMVKRPFGFVAQYKGAEYKFTAGAHVYKYQRTK